MSEPFVGQIIPVAFGFAPKGWATCDGQILSLSQNTALFSLLGTMYGGDGKSNFGLPDLRGAVPIGLGQGPGLQDYVQGELSGTATVTVLDSENAAHTHTPVSATGRGLTLVPNPVGAILADGVTDYAPATSARNATIGPLSTAGGNQPHNNMMPYLTIIWIIALQGVFPARS